MSGGEGIDLVNYTLSPSGVVVTLDDVADDGPDGHDNVRSDVEDITGTAGDDTLVGDADANQLAGGNGSDKLVGGGGFDALYVEEGVDNLQARDGNPERVDCGGDNDFATVDALDHLSGCESIDVSTALQADLDHDGFALPADCDDHDSAVRPSALDWPDNGLDENCDGADATIRDRDGVLAPADCNDADPALRPGAPEVFGDAVDQDCNGSADPLQTIDSTVQTAFQTGRRTTRVRRLQITRVQGGTIVRVQCPRAHRRRACRRAVTTVAVARDTRQLDLRRRLGLRSIRPRSGTRVVVWLLRTDSLGRRVSIHFRALRTPSISERCARPGFPPASDVSVDAAELSSLEQPPHAFAARCGEGGRGRPCPPDRAGRVRCRSSCRPPGWVRSRRQALSTEPLPSAWRFVRPQVISRTGSLWQ